MFFKKLFYYITNFFNKDKLKLRNIGCKMLIMEPDGVYEVDLENQKVYKISVKPLP